MFKVNIYYPDGRFFYSSSELTTREEAVEIYNRHVLNKNDLKPGSKIVMTETIAIFSHKVPAHMR